MQEECVSPPDDDVALLEPSLAHIQVVRHPFAPSDVYLVSIGKAKQLNRMSIEGHVVGIDPQKRLCPGRVIYQIHKHIAK